MNYPTRHRYAAMSGMRPAALRPSLRHRATDSSHGVWRAPLVGLAIAVSIFFLGWIISKGLGIPILAAAAVVLFPAMVARTRWATTFAVAPALLYPVSAINSAKILHTINIAPLVAVYLLANVVWMYTVRRRTTTPSAIGLAGLLVIIGAGLLESVHAGNGTLGHSVTTFIFWLSAFFLGSLVADDSRQFAALGICALPLAGLALWQAATGSNPYNHFVGSLHFASSETLEGLQRSTSTFGQPLVAGAALTILAASAMIGRHRFALLVAPVVLLGAIVTVSRSALIGAAVIFLIAIAQGTARRRIVIILGLIVVAVLLAVTVFPRFATSLEGRLVTHSYKEVARTAGPARLLHDLSDNPIAVAFGGGIGTTELELAATGGIGGVDTYDNQFVETTFDIGFIPWIAALCLLGYAMFRAQPDRRTAFLPVVIGAIAMLLFFSGLAWPSYSVLVWLMFGALTSQTKAEDKLPYGHLTNSHL
jgi:hypothetical protein